MNTPLHTSAWTLNNSFGWTIHKLDHMFALTPPNDQSSAIVIGTYTRSDNELITLEEMRVSLLKTYPDATPHQSKVGDYSGYTSSFVTTDENGQILMRVWCVFHDNTHLFINFNCHPSLEKQYNQTVDMILSSLKANK